MLTSKDTEGGVFDLNSFRTQLESEDVGRTTDGQGNDRLPRTISMFKAAGEIVELNYSIEAQKFSDTMRKYLSKSSIEDVYRELMSQLDAWKSIVVNIGVIGGSGVGKSTLINTLRRVRARDQGATAVGATQTTVKPSPYQYPASPNVILWDIPGVGTTDFPKESYLHDVDFEKYDFFIIVCATRFTENDYWFACEVQKARKHFYLVRTKVDADLKNEEEDYPTTFNKERVLASIREECTKPLKKEKLVDLFVALVGKGFDDLEIGNLKDKIISDRDDLQREAVIFTLRASTETAVKEITKLLLERVDRIAIAAGAVALVPLFSPLLSATLIQTELRIYKEQFGLDDRRLEEISKHARVPQEDVVRALGQHFWVDLTYPKVLEEMSQFENDSSCERSFLKKVASAFSFAHSFKNTPRFLRNCIESMASAATTIISKFLPKEYGR